MQEAEDQRGQFGILLQREPRLERTKGVQRFVCDRKPDNCDGDIPDVLPDQVDYTRTLSLSRLAYDDPENLLSPMLALALLTVVS